MVPHVDSYNQGMWGLPWAGVTQSWGAGGPEGRPSLTKIMARSSSRWTRYLCE